MDVRDSPWRPPRERLSEGSGRGKSSAENGQEEGPGARPPRASRPAGPFAEQRRPRLRRDRAFNPRILLRRLPTPFSPFLQPPNLNGPHQSALCVDGEAPYAQPPQEQISAPAHTPIALAIAHLLLPRTTSGAPGDALRDRNPTSRSGLLSAVLVPRDSSPVSFLHAARLPGLPDTHYHRPPAPLALRFPPAPGGARCSRPVFPCALSCDPNRESPEPRSVLGRNRGTSPGQPGSQGKGDQCGAVRYGGGGEGVSSPFFLQAPGLEG